MMFSLSEFGFVESNGQYCEVATRFGRAVIQDYACLGDAQSCSLPDKVRFAALVFAVFAYHCFLSNEYSLQFFLWKSPNVEGKRSLASVEELVPNMEDKRSIASVEELDNVKGKASVLAVLDYYISMHSDIFISASLGNMQNALVSSMPFVFVGLFI